MKSLNHIILLGSPGAGKGTLARYLESYEGYQHFSTGEALRREVKEQSALGKNLAGIVGKGQLVSDDVMVEMIRNVLTRTTKSLLLDGFPRTLEQARRLESIIPIFLVIYLCISEQTALGRITGRQWCSACQRVYNVLSHRPKEVNICDHCGGALVKRQDDEETIVLERIKIFHRYNRDIIQFYKDRKTFMEIDGEGSIENIFQQVHQAIQLRHKQNV